MGMDGLAKDIFKSEDYPAGEQLAAFQNMTSSVYQVQSLDKESKFAVETIGYQADELMFTDFKCQNARFRRTQQHLQGSNNDFLVLHAQLKGEELIHMEHGILRLLPGNIYLRDWAYTFESQVLAMHIQSVLIPRHCIKFGDLFNVNNPVLSWSMTSPEGRFIWDSWSSLFDQLPHLNRATVSTLSRGFIALLNGMVGNNNEQPRNKNPKLDDIIQYLKPQLRGEVSIEHLCEQFEVSRATLFRLFKVHGGINHYLDALRLERCYTELRFANPEVVTVGEVAAGWGYNDPTVFSRKFRNRFGVQPSKVIGLWFESDSSSNSETAKYQGDPSTYRNFRHWLETASGLK